MSSYDVASLINIPRWSLKFAREDIHEIAGFNCESFSSEERAGYHYIEAENIESRVKDLFKKIAKSQTDSSNTSIELSVGSDTYAGDVGELYRKVLTKLFSEALEIKLEFLDKDSNQSSSTSSKSKTQIRFTWQKGYDFEKVYSQFRKWEKNMGWESSPEPSPRAGNNINSMPSSKPCGFPEAGGSMAEVYRNTTEFTVYKSESSSVTVSHVNLAKKYILTEKYKIRAIKGGHDSALPIISNVTSAFSSVKDQLAKIPKSVNLS